MSCNVLVRCVICIVAIGVLRGAGCSAWWVDVEGTVIVDQRFSSADGFELRFFFNEDGIPTEKDGSGMWGSGCDRRFSYPLRPACDSDTILLLFRDGTWEYEFKWCSCNVGVYYEAWLGAFIDLNGNERLDVGEPYGTWPENPLSCNKETEHRDAIQITIDSEYSL